MLSLLQCVYNFIPIDNTMKTKLILFAFILSVGALIASCSASRKTCPAYSKAKVEQHNRVNS